MLQLKPVPFKIFADFEPILESVKSYEGFYLKKYQDHIPYFFSFVISPKSPIL